MRESKPIDGVMLNDFPKKCNKASKSQLKSL